MHFLTASIWLGKYWTLLYFWRLLQINFLWYFSASIFEDTLGKSNISLKERKLPSRKFHWFWKFGWNNVDGTSEKIGVSDPATASDAGCLQQSEVVSSTTETVTLRGDAVDQNLLVTFRNLGQAMLENIQVRSEPFLRSPFYDSLTVIGLRLHVYIKLSI